MDGMNFSDGWRDSRSGARYDREDPAHIATVVASFPESDAADVDHAVRTVAGAPIALAWPMCASRLCAWNGRVSR